MSWWSELLQGIPLNAVLKERLALAEQKFKELEEENDRLKEQVIALNGENEALRKKVEQATVAALPPKERPGIMNDCYYFGDDRSRLYCPGCYDSKGKKHLTCRVGVMGRKCNVCGTLIGR